MEAFAAVLGILALALGLALLVARVDRLAFFAPRSSGGISASAGQHCRDRCRVDGRCPVTETQARWSECPLWKYVGADHPTVIYGSPFERQPAS